jgi:hypothetical protein
MKRDGLRLSLGWWTAIGVVVALYGWVLSSTHGLGPIGGRQSDYYNLLAHGFLQGQLSLDTPVPEALLKLPNPYDPAQRPAGLALHDASLYHGKYYIYFGPTAAVLLLLPFAALTGNDLPVGCAVGCFVLLGYLAQLALFRFYQRRYYPQGSAWIAAASALALGTCGFQLVLLARHSTYDLPISCGAAGFWWAMYFLIRSTETSAAAQRVACPPKPWRRGGDNALHLEPRLSPLWGGLALGLAIASRPVYLFTLPVLVLPLWGPRGWRRASTGALACGAILVLLLAYNFARFGNPLEFGQNYQLSGAIEGGVRHFSLGFLPFNLREYFWAGLQWGRYFPFVHLNPPAVLPVGMGGYEAAFGMFTNLPIYLLGLAGIAAVRPITRPILALLGAAVALTLVLGCYFGCVLRYEHDFAPAWLLLACCGLMAAADRLNLTRFRFGWRVAALGLSIASACVALFAAMTLRHDFAIAGPQALAAAGRFFNAPVGAAERLAGRPITGSVRLRLAFATQPKFAAEPLVTTGWPGQRDGIWVEYPDAHSVRFRFCHGSDQPLAVSPLYPITADAVHQVTVSLGSLYPPVTHPYFRAQSAAEQGARLARVTLTFDDQPAWQLAVACFDSTPELTDLGADQNDPRRFSGRILSAQPLELSPPPIRLPSRHLDLSLTLAASWAGRSFPLVSAGQTGLGDILFVRVLSPTLIQFGYDHWGTAPALSPPVPWPMDRPQPLEIQLPPAGPDVGTAPVRVASAGRELWSASVRRYPAEPYEIFPLQNLLGASSCDNLWPPATPGW